LGDEQRQFLFECVDGAGELADATQLIACDAHARGLRGARETAREPLWPVHGHQAAGRDLEFGPEVVEVPAQVVDQPRPCRDEPLAMVDEQPDVKLDSGELRDRQRLDSVPDRRPRDRDRVDHIRLAALARAVPGARGQLWRDAQHTLAPGDQETLERSGHVAAVLDRPHPLATHPRVQRNKSSKERRRARTIRSATSWPVAPSTAAAVCESLCVSVPITIIRSVPPVGITTRSDLRTTHLSRGGATLLSSQAEDPRAAASDTTRHVKPKVDMKATSQLAADPNSNDPAGQH
jgi:hypothetical protein